MDLPGARLNAIAPYFTMFPLTFPYTHLSSARKGEWVLDPFCGRGTTNFAARMHSLPTLGIDTNPVAVAIAQAKMSNATPKSIVKLYKRAISEVRLPTDMPNGDFWNRAYHKKTLIDICKVREYLISARNSSATKALRGIMLGILHGPLSKNVPSYLSNQMPRTFSTKPSYSVKYWKDNSYVAPEVDVLSLITRKASYFYSQLPPKVNGSIILFDATKDFSNAASHDFSWVITSPPYLGMKTYHTDQWVREWFLGGQSRPNYRNRRGISTSDSTVMTMKLTRVWDNVSSVCHKGARLIVRFGAIPSNRKNFREIILTSIDNSIAGWRVTSITDAGKPDKCSRQSNQFVHKPKNAAINEVDISAKLDD